MNFDLMCFVAVAFNVKINVSICIIRGLPSKIRWDRYYVKQNLVDNSYGVGYFQNLFLLLV